MKPSPERPGSAFPPPSANGVSHCSTEVFARMGSAEALLAAMLSGRWPQRSTDIQLVSQLLQAAARHAAIAEELVAS